MIAISAGCRRIGCNARLLYWDDYYFHPAMLRHGDDILELQPLSRDPLGDALTWLDGLHRQWLAHLQEQQDLEAWLDLVEMSFP